MAYSQPVLTIPGLRANSTGLATSQFKIGRLASTAGQVILSVALNSTTMPSYICGVISNAPGAYEEVEFTVAGVAKVKTASTAIAIGDWVGVNSTSQALKVTADNAPAIGRALEASTAANQIISVLLGVPGGGRF